MTHERASVADSFIPGKAGFYTCTSSVTFGCRHMIFCSRRQSFHLYCCLWNSNRSSKLVFCDAIGEIPLMRSAFSFLSAFLETIFILLYLFEELLKNTLHQTLNCPDRGFLDRWMKWKKTSYQSGENHYLKKKNKRYAKSAAILVEITITRMMNASVTFIADKFCEPDNSKYQDFSTSMFH